MNSLYYIKQLRRKFRAVKTVVFALVVLMFSVAPTHSSTVMERYFENTDHELTVYRIIGKNPGKTMMIIGGIQGDEPGGYIAADLYADLVLEKGNLIVVPRANFYSIKLNQRGVNGDMNRKFASNPPKQDDYDVLIVEKLKQLMAESDVLLNLHEGSGFFYPEYVSNMKNPGRYGQSIIIDTKSYQYTNSSTIDLAGPATNVIREINSNVEIDEHRFHLNNHNTFSESTLHREQRGSATFNALSLFGIPSYGIESSKSITSIETKVRYQTLAINAFMKEYGIVPEHPSVYLPIPELDHLVIEIGSNANPFAIKNGSSLTVPQNTSIKVTSVVANYKRGISVDIIAHGNTNDIGRSATMTSSTSIAVYKDAYKCGEITVTVTDETVSETTGLVRVYPPMRLEKVEIAVAGKKYALGCDETLTVVRGDTIILTDAVTSDPSFTDFRINFYGFIGNKNRNDAEDRGYVINTGKNLMPRFSIDGTGNIYRIEALHGSAVIGNVFLKIIDPEVHYVIVEHPDGTKHALTPGTTMTCDLTDSLRLLSVISNVTAEPYITASITHSDGTDTDLTLPATLTSTGNGTLHFHRESKDLGSVSFRNPGRE